MLVPVLVIPHRHPDAHCDRSDRRRRPRPALLPPGLDLKSSLGRSQVVRQRVFVPGVDPRFESWRPSTFQTVDSVRTPQQSCSPEGSARACARRHRSTSTRCSGGGWWTGWSRLLGRSRPTRLSSSPLPTARASSTGSTSPCRPSLSAPVTRLPRHAMRWNGVGRRPARALGRHADVEPGASGCSARSASRRGCGGHSAHIPSGRSQGVRARHSRAEDGNVQAIVEAGDATPEELAVEEVNSSIYVFAADRI